MRKEDPPHVCFEQGRQLGLYQAERIIDNTIDLFWIEDYDKLKHDRNLMFTSLKVKLKEAFA